MTSTIQQLLTQVLQGYNQQASSFTLDPKGFGEPTIQTVLQQWTAASIELSNVSTTPVIGANNLILISGTASYLNVQNQPATLTIGVQSQGAPAASGTPFIVFSISLPGSTPTSWTFATSFPALAQYDSQLKGVGFQAATFSLASAAFAANALSRGSPVVSAGLNFLSNQVTSTHEGLAAILAVVGDGAQATISGVVTILQGSIQSLATLVPGFNLNSPTANLNLLLVLPISVAAVSRLAQAGDPVPLGTPYVCLLLNSQVTIGELPAIPLTAVIGDMGRVLIIGANLAQAAEVGLSALQAFLANQNLTAGFSQYYSLADSVLLQGVEVQLLMPQLTLGALQVTVALAQAAPWQLLGGQITLNSPGFVFMLDIGQSDTLIATVSDDVTVGDIAMSVIGSFGLGSPSFSLSSTQGFSLSDLFTQFLPSATGFPTLDCENLQISLTPNTGPYSLSAAITSPWALSAGAASISLTQASIQLAYDGTTTGTLAAAAQITPAGGGSPIQTSVSWRLPGDLTFTGSFPDINLTQLAQDFANVAGLTLPAGCPAISLQNANVTLALSGSGGSQQTYEFSLQAQCQFGTDQVGVICEVVDSGQGGFGFLAGLWESNWNWSPASIQGDWSNAFGSLLADINFSNAGLIVSTLQTAPVPFTNGPAGMPGTVQEGLTFFSQVDLSGGALAVLGEFFPGQSGIEFFGVIADPLVNSSFTASIGVPSQTTNYRFQGLQFTANFAGPSFLLQAGATFDLIQIAGASAGQSVPVNFEAGGTISGTPPQFDVYLVLGSQKGVRHARSLCAQASEGAPPAGSPWVNPLGVQGITVNSFYGEIGFAAESGLTVGFDGNVSIDSTQYGTVTLDVGVILTGMPEAPVVQVFKFDLDPQSGKQVALTDLIQTFTGFPIAQCPVLDNITLADFNLFLVTVPWTNPVTNTPYGPGFWSSGNVSFFGLEAIFDIAVSYQTGINATATLSPINLASGALSITGASASQGPAATLSTSPVTAQLNGQVDFLGASAALQANAVLSAGEYQFQFSIALGNPIFTGSLQCTMASPTSVTGAVNFQAGVQCSPTLSPFGTINIDDTVSGSLGVSVSDSGFTATVTGSFTWQGQSISLLNAQVSLQSWADLPSAIASYVEANVETLFANALKDASTYVAAILSGAITSGAAAESFVVNVLAEQYQLSGNIPALLTDLAQVLVKIPLSGQLTFNLSVPLPSIVPPTVHVDLGHLDGHIGGHSDHHGDLASRPRVESRLHLDQSGPHFDQNIGVKVSPPSLSGNLLQISEGGHFDLSTVDVHADLGEHVDVSPHVDIDPVVNMQASLKGQAKVSSKVAIDQTPDLTAHVDAKMSGSVSALGIHLDMQPTHADS